MVRFAPRDWQLVDKDIPVASFLASQAVSSVHLPPQQQSEQRD